jgi:hypothetical protein
MLCRILRELEQKTNLANYLANYRKTAPYFSSAGDAMAGCFHMAGRASRIRLPLVAVY